MPPSAPLLQQGQSAFKPGAFGPAIPSVTPPATQQSVTPSSPQALTPNLTDAQLKQNIDALQKGGMTNDKVQAYVNNYAKGPTGYTLKSPTASPQPTTPSPDPLASVHVGGNANGNYFKQVADQWNSGQQMVNQPFEERAVNGPMGQGQALAGALHVGAGLGAKILAPAAPLFNAIGAGVNAVGGFVADPTLGGRNNNPTAQANKAKIENFAQSPAGEKTMQGAQVVSDASQVVGLLSPLKEGLPDISRPLLEKPAPSMPRVVKNRVDALSNIEQNNAPVRKVLAQAKSQGIDTKTILAQTDLLHGAVDKSGTINTVPAMSDLNEFIKPQESVISDTLAREGVKIPLTTVENSLRSAVDKSGLEGDALENAHAKIDASMKGLARRTDAQGNIPLAKIQDAKVNKYSTIDYTNEGAKMADKAIARTYKTLVEDHTKSADVHALNKELTNHYAVMNLLEKLNGKKVDGGRMAKYFAQTVGGLVGSHFGPLGTIAGAELGRSIKGGQMARTFNGKTGTNLQQSSTMKAAIEKAKTPRDLPALIPGRDYTPASGGYKYAPIPLRGSSTMEKGVPLRQSSNNLGSRNTTQSNTIAPTRSAIPETVPQTGILGKAKAAVDLIKKEGQRGFIKLPKNLPDPMKVAESMDAGDIKTVRNYVDLVNGKITPGGNSDFAISTKMDTLLQHMGIKDFATTKAKNDYIAALKDHYETQQGSPGDIPILSKQNQPRHPVTQQFMRK